MVNRELERQGDVATKGLGRREESELVVHCGVQQRRGVDGRRRAERLNGRAEGREGAMQRSRQRPARLNRCGLSASGLWRHRDGVALQVWNAHAVRCACRCAAQESTYASGPLLGATFTLEVEGLDVVELVGRGGDLAALRGRRRGRPLRDKLQKSGSVSGVIELTEHDSRCPGQGWREAVRECWCCPWQRAQRVRREWCWCWC